MRQRITARRRAAERVRHQRRASPLHGMEERAGRTWEWPRLTSCRMASTSSTNTPSPTRFASASSILPSHAKLDVLQPCETPTGWFSQFVDVSSSYKLHYQKPTIMACRLFRSFAGCWPGSADDVRQECGAAAPGDETGLLELVRRNHYTRELLR